MLTHDARERTFRQMAAYGEGQRFHDERHARRIRRYDDLMVEAPAGEDPQPHRVARVWNLETHTFDWR